MSLEEELWRECAAWLTRCKMIPEDHKANQPYSEIKSLAAILRDGVMLCNLLNYLDPCVFDLKDFNKKPQMAHFLCIQNINLFLDGCKSNFGLKEADMFEPTMLYDLTNFHRVLITLSKLSQSRKIQSLHNITGFNSQLSQSEKSGSEDDIYKELQVAAVNQISCHDNEEHDTKIEEVYQDLCSIQNKGRNQFVSTETFQQRDYVIKELVETEINYLDVLIALKCTFMQALEKVLTKDVIRTIFPCIKELVDIHEKYLKKLQEAVQSDSKLKISTVFLEFREPFLIYGDYCSSMTSATDTLRDVCKKSCVVDQAVNQCQKEHSGGRLQLRDILSVPMQRILKYHLLLDKLVHETNPSHEDFHGLKRAKEAMVDVAQYSNEVKRDSEHLVVIQKVKESILDLNLPNGNNLEQYGRLLLDGDLNIKAHEDQKTKHRYAFVFEKVMILAKNSNAKIGEGQYVFRDAYNLHDYRMEICHSRRTLGRDGRLKYSLLLARKTQSTAFTLYMKTEEEREKWKRAFVFAMDVIEPVGCRNTDHKFNVCTFDFPITCIHCLKFLKGKIHQGYKCKTCEIAVHKGCISSTGRCKQNQYPPPVSDRLLSEFNWFVGSMDRDVATTQLEKKKSGTYLLRVRPQGVSNSNETIYALSLKTDNNITKHMKIYQKPEKMAIVYYLSTRRFFKSIIELVSFYERNDLGENFSGLNQLLQWPFKEVIVTALYDFSPSEPNQLLLKQGCKIIVIGKEGDSKGWWRGKTMEKVGFFPKEYVNEHHADFNNH
ncbi:protein vav isoform X2 [Malaya genurostris]|uniref:protein vav isoform X2 n=1 Tax=Malaya genurostris TaxID=325434 RepID=UPI0026F3AEDF|nr:protein vav isoform X2 [Malaya genurostris]